MVFFVEICGLLVARFPKSSRFRKSPLGREMEMKAQKIGPLIIRITDILQQVQYLNGMVALHRDKS